jgi:RND family efflux transporter MFP subunit
MMRHRRIVIRVLGAAALTAVIACQGEADKKSADAPAPTTAATPVQVAKVRADTLLERITAPGQTEVLNAPTLRAPFAGVLTTLLVNDGDRVRAGGAIGTIVSMNSAAALDGARAMLASARTATDSSDAARALKLAQANQVAYTLHAPADGVVLSHSASAGDRLGEGDEVVRLASARSSVFIAEVPQSQAARVRENQPAQVQLAASNDVIHGVVHGILPAASSEAFSVRVRIDIEGAMSVPSVGLFGTATITVGRAAGVLSVPTAAVLNDDVTGVSRVAKVEHDRVRWIDVKTGVEDHGRIAVSGTGLASGDTVILSGQVGLPDSVRVRVTP